MTNLVLALIALTNFSTPAGNAYEIAPRNWMADLPLNVPKGWKTQKEQGATTLTPGDVPSGKIYAVIASPTEGKAGSLDEIFEGAKKSISESGTFKEVSDVKQAKSAGGWDYRFVLGTIESGSRGLLAQVTAVKKGDEGGAVLVFADSVETMTKYADDFSEMLRGMGAPKGATTTANSGKVDLQYTVPPGWVKKQVEGYPQLVKDVNEEWTKYRVSLLIFPTEDLRENVRGQFLGYWKSFVTPNFDLKIAPMPLMARLRSGYACAYDGDSIPNSLTTVVIYMIVHGGKVVPVMGIFSGPDWNIKKDVEEEVTAFIESATIPNASSAKLKLFAADKLAGDWSESGTSFANYVTRAGAYAGDATISTASYFTLGSDGQYSSTKMAVGAAGNIREKRAGAWSVEDDELVLGNVGRHIIFGYGDDPKVGRFLIMSNYPNQRTRIKFTNPRGLLQATWLKAK